MLIIQKFVCNMLQVNCYVVSDSTRECVIIDCGAYYPEERQAIVNYIRKNDLVPKHLLATHGHLDHLFGINTIFDEFGLRMEVHHADEQYANHPKMQAENFFGMHLHYDFPTVGKVLADGDLITFGNHQLQVIETPGHSQGSVFFYCKEEKVAFSGDTLFRHSIGRTDLDGGSMFMIIQSLRMVSQLPDNVVVYPGHGDATTIGEECAHNPYIDR